MDLINDGNTCISCKKAVWGKAEFEYGQCHLNPPVPILLMKKTALDQAQPEILPVYPPITKNDWCAQWESVKH